MRSQTSIELENELF